MKKVMTAILLFAAAALACSCANDDDEWLDQIYGPEASDGQNAGEGGSTAAASGELTTFTVAIDTDSAEPAATAEAYLPDADDDLAQQSFGTEVTIHFDGTSAQYTAPDGVSITASGAHVVANHGSTKGVAYRISGTTTDGSLTILGDKKYEVVLNGADIVNPDSAALSLLSKKRAYVVVADGTTNSLADGTASKAGHKGALYAKGKLIFQGGTGRLSVAGNYNNAIHSADYIVFASGSNVYATSSANHGVKANDGVFINGGVLNVEVSAAAAKGINSEAGIVVTGGRTTVVTTGGGVYEDGEAKAAAAVTCDSTFRQTGGELLLRSTGAGGKGVKAGVAAYFEGGTLRVITEGTQYRSGSDTASPKGVKAGVKGQGGYVLLGGTDIMVRTGGSNGEGIESKGTLDITGGTVRVAAYDDAINSAGNMTVSGGTITAVGRGSDGLDANGNMYITGGTIVAFGAGGAESGIDCGEQYRLYISGGNIFGIGGRIDASLGSTSQGIVSTSGSVTANSTVTISDSGNTIATFIMPPYSYNGGTMLVSAPSMVSGTSYSIDLGGTTTTATASNSISSSMGGGMPGGGGHGRGPGGW